jgi:hypothetical protein
MTAQGETWYMISSEIPDNGRMLGCLAVVLHGSRSCFLLLVINLAMRTHGGRRWFELPLC